MLPDRVSNPGPPTYESGALPIALRGPAWPKCLLGDNMRTCSDCTGIVVIGGLVKPLLFLCRFALYPMHVPFPFIFSIFTKGVSKSLW